MIEKEEALRKELKVSAIENGTVIDHIPAKNVFQAIKILGLDHYNDQLLVGTNLDSKKYGKKGIIKVNNRYFKSEEINKIALVAPSATLIEIKNFKVIRKQNVEIPMEIIKIARCFNPNCITNHESITTRFYMVEKDGEQKLKCHYCEKMMSKNEISFI